MQNSYLRILVRPTGFEPAAFRVGDILVELGKRKMVGGQEDMIVDVAYQLAQKQKWLFSVDAMVNISKNIFIRL